MTDPPADTRSAAASRDAHRITIEPFRPRVRVRIAGAVIVDTCDALLLREGRLPEVLYLPRRDAALEMLVRSTHRTHCPFKGHATYYTVQVGSEIEKDVAWSYEDPIPEVEPIRDRLAFFADRVELVRGDA